MNKRTMMLPFSPTGEPNSGLHLELRFGESSKIYTVRVVQKMSILELLAFVLAVIVGMVLLARIAKAYLADLDYYRALDRECAMLFGAASNNRLSDSERFKQEV